MSDILSRLAALRRPGLLVRAARMGRVSYRRERDLNRILNRVDNPATERALALLLEAEEELEAQRKHGATGYSPMRHVEVLSAVMAEAQRVPAPA
ncbi:MAG: DUF6477 family protein [Maritimibacter sp.]|jgi:hypothetical protein